MKFDSSQITVVIAIAAIISPVIVAVVNDIFNYRLKKLEFQSNIEKLQRERDLQRYKTIVNSQVKERELISNFIAATNHCYQYARTEDYGNLATAKEEFDKTIAKVFVELPPTNQEQLKNWLDKSHTENKSEWQDLATEINSKASDLLFVINEYDPCDE